ncbi:hypothetical protein CsSME_00053756 [Camellia sinensis var. sinensis]
MICILSLSSVCLSCRPVKMSSSSMGGGEGQMLRFISKKCRCGKKAYLRRLLCILSLSSVCLSCRPVKMSSSSMGGGEGQMLRFISKKCRCGKKATIRIVEFEKHSKGTMCVKRQVWNVVIFGLGATHLDLLPLMEEIRLMVRS